jgi:hypothetical protein
VIEVVIMVIPVRAIGAVDDHRRYAIIEDRAARGIRRWRFDYR